MRHYIKLFATPVTLVFLMLASVVAYELYVIDHHKKVKVTPVAAAKNTTLPDIDKLRMPELPRIGALQDVTERPLFDKERKKPEVVATEDSNANRANFSMPPSSSWDLSAIVMAGKGKNMVVLKSTKEDRVVRVKEGMTVSGWKVAAINPNDVLFENGSSQERMVLVKKNEDAVASNEEDLNAVLQAAFPRGMNINRIRNHSTGGSRTRPSRNWSMPTN
ncbi:MAG: hypothetical protein GC138_08390 [Gammaproteobacteria bacterium]|nr:hypothetical protein [Gammaproteobacteria bacterium]